MFFSKVVPETWSLITPFIDDILERYDITSSQLTTSGAANELKVAQNGLKSEVGKTAIIETEGN